MRVYFYSGEYDKISTPKIWKYGLCSLEIGLRNFPPSFHSKEASGKIMIPNWHSVILNFVRYGNNVGGLRKHFMSSHSVDVHLTTFWGLKGFCAIKCLKSFHWENENISISVLSSNSIFFSLKICDIYYCTFVFVLQLCRLWVKCNLLSTINQPKTNYLLSTYF